MTHTSHPTAYHIRRNIPDDAPASAFAPSPVGAYRRGFEDRYYDNAISGAVIWLLKLALIIGGAIVVAALLAAVGA